MDSNEAPGSDIKPFRFSEGERVLCFHGPLIYDAKCLKLRTRDDGVAEYLVHYAGWNKSWDEWVTDVRILKYNEQNLARQREVSISNKDAKKVRCKATLSAVSENAATATAIGSDDSTFIYRYTDTAVTDDESRPSTPNSDKPSSQSGDSEEGSSSSRKRLKRFDAELGVETEEKFSERVEITIKIPEALKPWLVDDWDLICRQKKLFLLPAKTTVDTIIEDYIKQKTTIKNPPVAFKESAAVQTANSLKEYFNVTLGSQLLYKYERVQHSQILEKFPDQPPSSVYGAAHLLRLFVILGGLIVYTQINEKTVVVLRSQLHDFLKYLLKNSATLFSTQFYEYATPEYNRLSTV